MLARIYRHVGGKIEPVTTCRLDAGNQRQAEAAVEVTINGQAIRTSGTYFVATEAAQLFKVEVRSRAQVVTQLYVGPESD